MDIKKQLTEHLEKVGTAPFLFIGSGFSRRYINLETWEALLRRFAEPLPRPYTYYKTGANGDLPRTATALAEAFYDLWWADDAYEQSREDNEDQLQDRSSCLKIEISKYIGDKKYVPGTDVPMDDEIALLKNATVDGIITTNWDTLLETIFPDFATYIGQEEVLFSQSQGIAEIYKIHGCSTAPNSLVLTAGDYDDFNRRNPYLAAKLLTFFVEHPVIFIGYSLSDENITEILKQIASCLTNDNIDKLKDRLIFLQRDENGTGDSFETSVTQIGGHTIPLTIIRTNDFRNVYQPLCELRRRFSARLLRKMKEHIYELVMKNDPGEKLAVVDINNADSFKDLEVVYGVGLHPRLGEVGYSPISRTDLLKDVMAPKSKYDAQRILSETLPGLFTGSAKYVPIFRYLREAGRIAADGTIDTTGLDDRVIKASKSEQKDFHPPGGYKSETNEVQNVCKTVEGVIIRYPSNSFYFLPLLKRDQVDVDELGKYITSNLKLMTDDTGNTQTYFRSLICFYDWLKYR